jgi:hypothetical protein
MAETTPKPFPAPLCAAPAPAQDGGALRLGGLSPLFPPAAVADPGLLRMGGLSPLFARD